MIHVNIRGNIGNQLFEYACARKLQKKYNKMISLNIYDIKKYHPEYKFNLDGYLLNNNVRIDEKKLPFYFYTRTILLRIFRKIFPNIYFNFMKKFGCYTWLGNTYKEFPDKEHKNIYIDGYFQSSKYFDDIRDELLLELVPKETKNKKNEELYKKINSTESVCITIRRGDYLSNDIYKKKFFVCDDEYFYKSIKRMKEKVPNCTFFIFSDDIEWAKKNLKINEEIFFETGNDTVFEKLRLMSSCKHFILSNSSFSWWAQYLSQNKNKIVLAPSIWYVNQEKTDIYQENWELIEVRR